MHTVRVSCASSQAVVFTADSDLHLAGAITNCPVFITSDAFKAASGYNTLLNPGTDAVEDVLELQLHPLEDKVSNMIIQSAQISGIDIFIPQGTKIYLVPDVTYLPAVVHLIFHENLS